MPAPDEQKEIERAGKALDLKLRVHSEARLVFANFIRTLLHKLMTVQARVHDLDLSAISESAAEAAGVA